MTKISKIIAGASALSIFGLAVLPMASYAASGTATTKVQVTVGETCIIGDNASDTTNVASPLLQLTLSAATPSGEVSSNGTAGNGNIGITCNSTTGWTLTQAVDHANLTLGGGAAGTVGFTPWASGTSAAAFASNTWGMKYTGSGVVTPAAAFHAPSAQATVATVADATLPATSIVQTFGAKTDGTLGQGTYSAIITYTLAAN